MHQNTLDQLRPSTLAALIADLSDTSEEYRTEEVKALTAAARQQLIGIVGLAHAVELIEAERA